MATRDIVTDALTGKTLYRQKDFSISDKYVYPKGRMFGAWINANGRNSGAFDPKEGDLIETAQYVIESILRDEVFVLRDLKIDTVSFNASNDEAYITIYTLPKIDGYLDYAYLLHNQVGILPSLPVIAYDYTNQTLTVQIQDANLYFHNGDYITLTNVVNSNNTVANRIDIKTFDTIDAPKVKVPIIEQQSYLDVIDTLCFESFLLYTQSSFTGAKIVSIDDTSNINGVLTTPLIFNGSPNVRVELSDIDNVYSRFEIGYKPNIASGVCSETAIVDRHYNNIGLSSTYMDYCAEVEDKYHVSNTYKYDISYLHEDDVPTFIEKLVKWFTWQKLKVRWVGDLQKHLKYEIGDKVLIDHKSIPNNKRNSAYFIVIGKSVNLANYSVTLSLLEIR